MFRAQQNAFDDVVAKATDENLTAENWEFIMDVCDKVTTEDNGAKDAVATMIKRMAHRNANVQLYTLELANALSQNCGIKMHVELASRAFTDALLRLANDRNTHQQVKAKILERMQEWAEMFKKDPSLGIMGDQYQKLKSQNPNLHPPSAPSKSRLTDVDRQKEEEELQMALKLSIQDKSTTGTAKSSTAAEIGSSQTTATTEVGPPQPVPSGTTAATVSRVRALFDFTPSEPGELRFKKGDIIAVLESVFKDWWKGSLRGQTGIFPLNYVEKLADPTPDELQREAHMESEVFAEIKNVEKLLTLLSTSSSELRGEDNDEITKLYHQTLTIRPKLIELIGKYSQKKDDFTQLNEKFIKARRDYESLLESSMAQPPQHQQGYGFGRPQMPLYGGYGGGYPPQNGPSQQEPQRFYSPAPPEQQQQQQYPTLSGTPGYPQRNGPAPFYMVGQAQQQQSSGPQPQGHPGQESAQPYQQVESHPRIPSGSKPPPITTSPPPPATAYPQMQPQTGHRPESTYTHPQELATSRYSASINSQEDPYSATAPMSATSANNVPHQYSAYAPPLTQLHAPTHDPPPAPTAGAPEGAYADPRSAIPTQYKPYQRPGSSAGGQEGAPSAPPPDNAADFYRQSAY